MRSTYWRDLDAEYHSVTGPFRRVVFIARKAIKALASLAFVLGGMALFMMALDAIMFDYR